jgi:hypothetical protein
MKSTRRRKKRIEWNILKSKDDEPHVKEKSISFYLIMHTHVI